nr:hypothetical protein [Marasmius crinis-equi]
MLKDMPFEILNWHKDLSKVKLEDFFGFCEVKVYCPKDIVKPLLPHKHNNETIFPTGGWKGYYFSEELKAVLPYGYKFKLIKGYEFSKINLFKDYVDHFYYKKKNAKSDSERLIAKMHLNQLYGIFGRKQELLETKNVYNKDLIQYVSTRIIKNIIEINDNITTLIFVNNINKDILSELDKDLELDLSNSKINSTVKSNVAIAAAVTSYARIHMIQFKLDDNVVYTDTDSIFTKKILDEVFLGKELGLMKDELSGQIINEGYFLGIKQYGYYYHDKNNNRIEKSVFAGVPRDSISFEEIKEVFKGETIVKNIPTRFYRSFSNLKMTISDTHLTIKIKNNFFCSF